VEQVREARHAAADAAAYAAAAAYADAAAWVIARDILTEAIQLGAHGALDMAAPETEARADELLRVLA
jgi:hypothetical protein